MPDPVVTPPASTPDISQANGAAIAQGIGAVASSIALIVQVAEGSAAELALMTNPCVRMADLENRLMAAQEGLDKMLTAVNFFAAANQGSVESSIRSWGEAPGNTGGKAFPFWLWESGAIQHFPEAALCALPPFFLCWAAISQGLPARGDVEPSSSNRGYRLGPGLYRYPGAAGTWRGSTFVREWEAWVAHQQAEVWNPATGRENWRARLVTWCGRWRQGWEVWVPGDPISKNSTIGRSRRMVAAFAETVELARDRCAEIEEFGRELAQDESTRLNDMVLQSGLRDQTAAVLAAEDIASDERQLTTLTIAGVAALGLYALLGKK